MPRPRILVTRRWPEAVERRLCELFDTTLNTDEHGLIYGDWSELLIGIWSEIDILVNPYETTAYSKGNISIRAMATVDTGLRQNSNKKWLYRFISLVLKLLLYCLPANTFA